jgi:hypothetical protein
MVFIYGEATLVNKLLTTQANDKRTHEKQEDVSQQVN